MNRIMRKINRVQGYCMKPLTPIATKYSIYQLVVLNFSKSMEVRFMMIPLVESSLSYPEPPE